MSEQIVVICEGCGTEYEEGMCASIHECEDCKLKHYKRPILNPIRAFVDQQAYNNLQGGPWTWELDWQQQAGAQFPQYAQGLVNTTTTITTTHTGIANTFTVWTPNLTND